MSTKRRPAGARRPATPVVRGASRAGAPSTVPGGRSGSANGASGGAGRGAAGDRSARAVPDAGLAARRVTPVAVTDAPAGPKPWVPWLSFGLCILALADSAYLTYTHFNPGALVCSSTGIINCAKVTTSPQSYVLGIPVAILGLAFYAVMTVLHSPWLWRDTGVQVAGVRVPAVLLARLRLAGVVVGIGMVIYLVVAELFIIKNICEYCTGVHILTFVLFVTVVLSYPAQSYRARWLAWTEASGAAAA